MENKVTVKIIAMYLPQYHVIPENNEFWGKDFTDWVAVKSAKPLFDNHLQPRIPLNNNYYDLSQKDSIVWQARLAKEYGIYGFGIYHYWFNSNENLLTKPSEILLNNKDIDMNFLFCWDNNSWVRSWSRLEKGNDWAPKFSNKNGENGKTMIKLDYGSPTDWEKHFNYLLSFFKDPRYIKQDNKPIFMIHNPNTNSIVLSKKLVLWNELAKKNGFNGITFIVKKNYQKIQLKNLEYFQHNFSFPWYPDNLFERIVMKFDREVHKITNKPFVYSYDKFWERVLSVTKKSKYSQVYNYATVSYDDTPRRGLNGKIVMGATPEKFYIFFKEFIKLNIKQKKEYVFLNAWNEWGEGAMLEPDEINKYGYLEKIKAVMEELGQIK